PKGKVWAAVTANTSLGNSIQYLVSYTPGDKAPRCHGPVAISNPDYTKFTDDAGKALPWHHGTRKLSDGTVTSAHAILGVADGLDGSVYSLMLAPYTLLQVPAEQLK